MDLDLGGKTALVTGSSKGLGFATARLLAAEGCNVVICGRDEKSLTSASDAISAEGGSCLGLVTDLNDESARERLVQQAMERFGAIDIAVLNTGGPAPGNFQDIGLSDWDRGYQTMIRPVVDLIQRVTPGMIERKWGRLLTITSLAVKSPVEMLALSGSLRMSLAGLMRVLANELGPHGITANSILPGYTLTERMEAVMKSQAQSNEVRPAEALASIEKNIPLRRVGRPEEFGATAAFLVSGPAGFINGQAILVDGGLVPTTF